MTVSTTSAVAPGPSAAGTAAAPAATPTTWSNFVDGAWQRPRGGGRLEMVDPSTGEQYGQSQLSRPEDVDAACESAARAARAWARTTPRDRSRALLAAADALESRTEELVAAECRNTGKPPSVVRTDEVGGAVDCLRQAAGAVRAPTSTAAGEYTPGTTSLLRREPVGVVAAVTPWNYPLLMAVWKVAPALAAGNAVVLKPAETAPVTPLMLAETLAEHLPRGLLNVVCGDAATGQALVSHPVPDLVALTGSTRAGRDVAAAAAPLLKRLHLELGGGAPALVLEDADVDAAVAGIVGAAFYNAGQSCTAASRVIAVDAVHDRLVAGLVAAARARRVGDPSQDVEHGPLHSREALLRVAALVDARPLESELHCGGDVLDRPGWFYRSTVVSGLSPTDELVLSEVFGPVVTVERVPDAQEAVARAAASESRLAVSVWTGDVATAHRAVTLLDHGTVWVNCHSVLPAEMPHTGVGSAGYGVDLGALAVEAYTRPQHVTLAL